MVAIHTDSRNSVDDKRFAEVNDLRFYLAKDSDDRKSLFTRLTEALNAGEYDLASTNMQSYGMDVTTRDFDGSTIGNASIRSAAITVEVTNRPTVRMGEGEFQVIHYDDNYKRNVVKLSKDGLDNGTNKIIKCITR